MYILYYTLYEYIFIYFILNISVNFPECASNAQVFKQYYLLCVYILYN